jgi:hypothetical protein
MVVRTLLERNWSAQTTSLLRIRHPRSGIGSPPLTCLDSGLTANSRHAHLAGESFLAVIYLLSTQKGEFGPISGQYTETFVDLTDGHDVG